ncbi:twin-arginine translocation signal domain-containing protein [Vibrio sp. Y2-5]|uniref:twin-arginine translocation signal domain-containing protein n=1 Tax=Vibrio TaxID=662 RepID=UPI00142E4EF8|nr:MULTISPECIES: twin-arginine translocation signal domain-containing protein [Vibrio]MBD0785658.1 twin-arginine translocation signal domain-containing protein [Vibrio sp. Y2-5]NIY94401.1 twin-arginine translocation signal domain-containing protein [Vibrio diazotrophicus]
MKKQQQDIDKSRRDLLKGLGTAAVAGAVGSTVSQSVSAQEPSLNVSTTKKEGYHETQHIRDYYDTL